MNNNANDNEQNTQALLFPCKTYNLGASGTDFFNHMYLYVQEGLQRVFFMTHRTIKIKPWLLILEICLDPIV